MAKGTINRIAGETGTTMLEFAAVLSILLSLTFAMVDFGRYVYANNIIQSAAQEGARAGVRPGGNIQEAAMAKILTLDPTKVSVSPHYSPDSEIRRTVQVDVTYEFRFITPFISAFASGPIELHGTASMLMFPEAL